MTSKITVWNIKLTCTPPPVPKYLAKLIEAEDPLDIPAVSYL